MSTITKEWLQQAINDYESVRDELPFGLDEYQGNILAALRIALASLEAEADYIRFDCGCCGWETIEDWRESDVCPKCNHHPMGKTELFTAPQPITDAERAELQKYRKAAGPKTHFLAGYDTGHSRGLTCGRLYKVDDQVRSHRIASAAEYVEQLENDN